MSVYRITKEKFEPLEVTSFEVEGIYERSEMQEKLLARPEILEEGLLILAKEYSDWEESNRRIDLLALDEKGRLVVVELKRSDQQSLMDLQAIRYAAMVANMTWDRMVAAHREYIGPSQMGGDAEQLIRSHLKQESVDVPVINTKNPRIILVSAEFSKELTTSVLWLNERDLDITCVKLQPCKSGDDVFLERSQVIPPPEAKEFQVRWRDREREAERRESSPVTSYRGDAALDVFREAAATVSNADQRAMLERVCEMAQDLEAKGLASLLTNEGTANTVFHMDLPGWNRSLAYGYRKGGVGFLRLIGSSLESSAPNAKKQIEKILDREIGRLCDVKDLPDSRLECLMECLTDAYKEAKTQVHRGADG